MDVSDVKDIKQNLSIYDVVSPYVELKWDGRAWVGLCPFHHEKTPSFKVMPDTNTFYCYGCNRGYSVIDFIMILMGKTYREAVDYICQTYGISLVEPPQIILESRKYKTSEESQLPQEFFLFDDVMDEYPPNHNIKEWIAEGISKEVLCAHNVRYDEEKSRIVFPIFNEKMPRKILTVKYRNLGESKKKYGLTNKMGRKDFMYWWIPNMQNIRKTGECILVESEKSVMKLESIGIKNSVAIMGHDITKQQAQILIMSGVKNIVVAFDKDVKYKEIVKQLDILRHYCGCSIIVDRWNLLNDKDAPIDNGTKIWEYLYENRTRI